MYSFVIGKFCKRDPFKAIILMLIDEEVEVLLNLLVDPFSLTISLWVIGCRGGNFNTKELVQLMHELGYKLCASVTDDLLGKSMEFPHMITEALCNSY